MSSIKSKAKSNRANGNRFEVEFAELLAGRGWWAHVMKQDASGQPADVIAVYRGMAYLFDCKICMDDRFDLSRIEPNQQDAMGHWVNLGNTTPMFVLKDSNGQIWMLDYLWAATLRTHSEKSVKCEERGHLLWRMEEWLAWLCE